MILESRRGTIFRSRVDCRFSDDGQYRRSLVMMLRSVEISNLKTTMSLGEERTSIHVLSAVLQVSHIRSAGVDWKQSKSLAAKDGPCALWRLRFTRNRRPHEREIFKVLQRAPSCSNVAHTCTIGVVDHRQRTRPGLTSWTRPPFRAVR